MTDRALSWVDEGHLTARILRGSGIPDDFEVVLYGTGPYYLDESTEKSITLKSLQIWGQHVRR